MADKHRSGMQDETVFPTRIPPPAAEVQREYMRLVEKRKYKTSQIVGIRNRVRLALKRLLALDLDDRDRKFCESYVDWIKEVKRAGRVRGPSICTAKQAIVLRRMFERYDAVDRAPKPRQPKFPGRPRRKHES